MGASARAPEASAGGEPVKEGFKISLPGVQPAAEAALAINDVRSSDGVFALPALPTHSRLVQRLRHL